MLNNKIIFLILISILLFSFVPIYSAIGGDGDDDATHLDDDLLSPGLGTWALMAWVYFLPSTAANSRAMIWFHYQSSSDDLLIDIYPYRTDVSMFSSTFIVEDGGTFDSVAAYGTKKDIRGQWHHWAWIRTAPSSSDGVYVFFDGILLGKDSARQVIDCDPAVEVYFASSGAGDYVKALFSDMILVRGGKELTVDDINAHMNRRYIPNDYTLLYYPFDGDKNFAFSKFVGTNDFRFRGMWKAETESKGAPVLQERE